MLPLLQVPLAFHRPIKIGAVLRGVGLKGAGVAIDVLDVLPLWTAKFTLPAANFGMAVQECETTSAVVIRGGNVAPRVGAAEHHEGGDEVTVINGVGMFVEENVEVARAPFFGI